MAWLPQCFPQHGCAQQKIFKLVKRIGIWLYCDRLCNVCSYADQHVPELGEPEVECRIEEVEDRKKKEKDCFNGNESQTQKESSVDNYQIRKSSNYQI